MEEKLCLQWNDFKENITNAFATLREGSDFFDVTLVCEDGKQFEAHRLVLALSSPFFQNVFQKAKHAHPLVYMRGMKSENLEAIIDFLYRGEASVYQEYLDSFLAIAEELQLKGLTGEANDKGMEDRKKPQVERKKEYPRSEATKFQHLVLYAKIGQREINEYDPPLKTVAMTSDMEELNQQLISMMVKTSRVGTSRNPFYKCTLCGKEAEKNNLRKHIEANHMEGISLPCNQCGKTFRSRGSLAYHKYCSHHQD